jgi:hypothetical protein
VATAADIARISRRSEALKSLSLGPAPQIDASKFSRFPEMQLAVEAFNEASRLRDERLKNLLSEALLAARDVPP